MLATVFRQSLRENLRPTRLLPWLLLVLLAMFLGSFWEQLASQDRLVDRYGIISYLIVFRLVALASAILTATILSAEVEQKTIVYLLTRPVPRWVLLLGRYLACSVMVSAIGAFGALGASIGVFGFRFNENTQLLNDLLAVVFGAFSYCALFTLFTLLFNRAMIVCLLFGFGWEWVVANLPGKAYYLSIFSHLQAIAHHPVTAANRGIALLTGSLNGNALEASTSIPVLLILIAVLVGLGVLVFSNFEYLPREDVE
jgi:ABC-2 type transport system permease protein